MLHLALDLSVKNTGYAFWKDGLDRPVAGVWQLASGLEWKGRAYNRLARNLWDLYETAGIDSIVFEEPLPASALHGHTNRETLTAQVGLAEHVVGFAEAIGARVRFASAASWRKHFLEPPAKSKRIDLKQMAIERCGHLGIEVPRGSTGKPSDDAADAIGLLDYQLYLAGVTPPWRAETVLVPQFQRRRA